MVRATWNGAVLAESDDTVIVEGNHYFPPETLNRAKRPPLGVPVEGPGELPRHRRGREGQPGRSVVLPRSPTGRKRSAAASPSGTASASRPTATTPGRSPACAAVSQADGSGPGPPLRGRSTDSSHEQERRGGHGAGDDRCCRPGEGEVLERAAVETRQPCACGAGDGAGRDVGERHGPALGRRAPGSRRRPGSDDGDRGCGRHRRPQHAARWRSCGRVADADAAHSGVGRAVTTPQASAPR